MAVFLNAAMVAAGAVPVSPPGDGPALLPPRNCPEVLPPRLAFQAGSGRVMDRLRGILNRLRARPSLS